MAGDLNTQVCGWNQLSNKSTYPAIDNKDSTRARCQLPNEELHNLSRNYQ